METEGAVGGEPGSGSQLGGGPRLIAALRGAALGLSLLRISLLVTPLCAGLAVAMLGTERLSLTDFGLSLMTLLLLAPPPVLLMLAGGPLLAWLAGLLCLRVTPMVSGSGRWLWSAVGCGLVGLMAWFQWLQPGEDLQQRIHQVEAGSLSWLPLTMVGFLALFLCFEARLALFLDRPELTRQAYRMLVVPVLAWPALSMGLVGDVLVVVGLMAYSGVAYRLSLAVQERIGAERGARA